MVCFCAPGEPLEKAVGAITAFDPLAVLINLLKARGSLSGDTTVKKLRLSFRRLRQWVHFH
jgi:hypothetical protein